jgi:hypothetical protein
MQQLSFLPAIEPMKVEPPTVWDLLKAGLAASEMTPITRADVERSKCERSKSKTT